MSERHVYPRREKPGHFNYDPVGSMRYWDVLGAAVKYHLENPSGDWRFVWCEDSSPSGAYTDIVVAYDGAGTFLMWPYGVGAPDEPECECRKVMWAPFGCGEPLRDSMVGVHSDLKFQSSIPRDAYKMGIHGVPRAGEGE